MMRQTTQGRSSNSSIKDVQNSCDERGIAIQKVGVSDVHLPFLIKTKSGSFQSVLAKIKLTVDLPQEFKGTHMSRFIEILSDWSQKPVSYREIGNMLTDTIVRLHAKRAHIDIHFKYFVEKEAPVSGLKSMLDYDCTFSASLARGEQLDFVLGIIVPFTSLCPCSKEISQYGAHNQRGIMRVKIKQVHGKFIWIEDLAKMLEERGSCQVYPLLKREDEKYVTEKAYENPKFVEDVLRDLVLMLRKLDGIQWFEVECENYESIHNHSAYATHIENVDK
ncbi:GTP cyclohydrolase FolE2 [Sporomusa acidovorans DSM 3132]|uniref:GTP cyclohydrolase FolE2 n=1 Tax=Sporomusa acidovorans (strain ATCC 49682 / DSM 3132 / Mol) TaxID=1123286 RepID=A0ABZ3J1L5_SPOA4|nr:GTP cyclohydrolase FolE2 [Sporomusa acidovorans DSM 3132]SDE84585.1 GTP cyclohydrolase I [Sporomusa acidovorans]